MIWCQENGDSSETNFFNVERECNNASDELGSGDSQSWLYLYGMVLPCKFYSKPQGKEVQGKRTQTEMLELLVF